MHAVYSFIRHTMQRSEFLNGHVSDINARAFITRTCPEKWRSSAPPWLFLAHMIATCALYTDDDDFWRTLYILLKPNISTFAHDDDTEFEMYVPTCDHDRIMIHELMDALFMAAIDAHYTSYGMSVISRIFSFTTFKWWHGTTFMHTDYNITAFAITMRTLVTRMNNTDDPLPIIHMARMIPHEVLIPQSSYIGDIHKCSFATLACTQALTTEHPTTALEFLLDRHTSDIQYSTVVLSDFEYTNDLEDRHIRYSHDSRLFITMLWACVDMLCRTETCTDRMKANGRIIVFILLKVINDSYSTITYAHRYGVFPDRTHAWKKWTPRMIVDRFYKSEFPLALSYLEEDACIL